MLGVRPNENVSAMKATEQTNQGIKAGVYLSIWDSPNTFTHFIVTIGGHIMRGHILLVHEILERDITILLKFDIILE